MSRFDENTILMLMYTSGTTGLPKGVVMRYNKNVIDRLRMLAGIILTPDSIYYTALQLFHGNALYVTITSSLIVGLHGGPVQAVFRRQILGGDREVQGHGLQHHRRHHPHPHEDSRRAPMRRATRW